MPLTLPARFYTDPAIFARELEVFFFGGWIAVGRADQIPARGDYVLRDVGGESLIVTRGNDDRVRAFFNVCRHRGTRLCEQAQGRFAGAIQCPYHAWTYDLSGRLIGAPHMDDVAGFAREHYPLREARVEEWDGHLFAHCGPAPSGAPPLAAHLDVLPARFAPWRMRELRLVHRIEYDVAANWKLIVQNYSECLHCPVLHPLLNRMHDYLGADNVPSADTYCGGSMGFKAGVETLSRDGRRRRAYLPGLSEAERQRVEYFAIYPNLLLTLHPDYMMTVTLWPRAVDRTVLVAGFHFHADEIATPDFEYMDAVELWDLTNREDWHISELAQAGIASRAYAPGPYSNREQQLHDFDGVVLRALGESRR